MHLNNLLAFVSVCGSFEENNLLLHEDAAVDEAVNEQENFIGYIKNKTVYDFTSIKENAIVEFEVFIITYLVLISIIS